MPDPTFSLRPALPADASVLSALASRTFTDTFRGHHSAENLAAFTEAAYNLAKIRAELEDPHRDWLLAEQEGEAVGYALMRWGHREPCVGGPDPVVELERIYALAAFQGRGLGPALMQACVDLALLKGARTMWLGVWERNARALAFYAKWGFRDVGAHRFLVGTDDMTDRILERELA
ncbi:MAG TPA: GNAT family N-acetyltransferase [Holophagaceae bacterium]|nr:GNAT family N-acetyltransferase [Holophagaceae bacterium]